MNLTQHFTLEELIHSEYAARNGLDNRPNADVLANLHVLADGLERVRTVLSVPLLPLSGYRSPKVNAGVRGALTSQHLQGLACDFIAPAYGKPLDVAKVLAQEADFVGFDQLIMELGQWVHVSFSDQNRRDILTATKGPVGIVYTRGLM